MFFLFLFNETIKGLHLPNVNPIHTETEMSFAIIFNIHKDIFKLFNKRGQKNYSAWAGTTIVLYIKKFVTQTYLAKTDP